MKAVRDDKRPISYDALTAFFMNVFPATVDLDTVDQELDALKQQGGETVIAYWTRHQLVTQKADILELPYDPVLTFKKRLVPGPVKDHVDNYIGMKKLDSITPQIQDVVAVAIERDQRPDIKHYTNTSRRDTTNAIVSTSHHQNGNRKRQRSRMESSGGRVDNSNVICYNCNRRGHRFGLIERPTCGAPITNKTRAYFKKISKKPKVEPREPVASGSGSSKAPAN